ncbi:MAG: ribonuclease BN, partial [Bacteroidetes bacterium RIFOXYB12_FULL_41_6]
MQFKSSAKKVGYLLKETFSGFINDNAIKLSAALSYYTIFSLAPLLIIIISLSGIFFGDEAVSGRIFGQISGLVGSEAALQIQEIIKNVKLSNSNTYAAIFGGVILLIGASGVFAEIQDSINYIWGIEAKPKRGMIRYVYNRLMSFSMIGSVGFLLLVGLIVNSLVDILSNRLAEIFPKDLVFMFYVLNVFLVFSIITLLFTI